MKSLLVIIFFGILGLSSAYAVPIHKWVDSKGGVHYSNLPPISGTRSAVLEYKGVGNTSQVTKKDPSGKEAAVVDPEVTKKINDEKEIARQNCVRSKESIQMLESGVRISRMSAAGVRETLDEKGRADESERAKKAMKEWCSE